jgi:hypothetical protein
MVCYLFLGYVQFQRRLIITTVDDTIQIWNFNSTHMISSFCPLIPVLEKKRATFSSEKQTVVFVQHDHAIFDSKKIAKKVVLLGTESGLLCACEEIGSSEVDNTPGIYFRRAMPTPSLLAVAASSGASTSDDISVASSITADADQSFLQGQGMSTVNSTVFTTSLGKLYLRLANSRSYERCNCN